MFLRASDYPAVFRRKEVFYIVNVFDLVSLLHLVKFLIEPHKYALSEQDTVVILFETHIVNTTIIDREDLPVRFYLQFQFRCQVKPPCTAALQSVKNGTSGNQRTHASTRNDKAHADNRSPHSPQDAQHHRTEHHTSLQQTSLYHL